MKDEDRSGWPLRDSDRSAPPAPAWFADAVDAPYERGSVEVQGARIDDRAWGEPGKPGLLFLHGNAAHLGWWSFLAPFFADDYRIVIPSLSGMGTSEWRSQGYSVDRHTAEGLAVAEAGGASRTGPPVMIGHSLGGLPVLRAAAMWPDRIRAGIVVDTALPTDALIAAARRVTVQPSYPDLPTALARFRLSPVQPCANPYIADFLARMALKQCNDGSWTWRFDRALWNNLDLGDPWTDLAEAKVPLAFVRGQFSELSGGKMAQRVRPEAPPGAPFIEIPEAHHHVMVDQPLALVASLRSLLAAWP